MVIFQLTIFKTKLVPIPQFLMYTTCMESFLPPTPLAHGATAEIYAWGDGQVLKLFYPDFSNLEMAQYEQRIAQAAARASASTRIPAPAPGEIIEVEGRWGLIYERVDGPSMAACALKAPWQLKAYSQQMAELHATLHRVIPQPDSDLPNMHKRLAWRIQHADQLLPATKETLLAILQALPQENVLCHGDFHLENILMTSAGPVIIDWIDASSGTPLGDVARTLLLMQVGQRMQSGARGILVKLALRLSSRAYLQRYFELCPKNPRLLRAWRPVIAAARLSEHVPSEVSWLVGIANRAVSRADNLIIRS
jgi:aminoglycoside phosphotransferase (APT) family kinase protein